MRLIKLSALRLFGLLVVLSVIVAGCEGGRSAGGGGGNQGGGEVGKVDLSGLEITVGSKEFTEQLILGQIAIPRPSRPAGRRSTTRPAWPVRTLPARL
jgi:hypothetical protein